jgi:hypothetical protein
MALSASPASPAISDQTKAEGEQVVREVFPQATIVRPSLAYGEDDHFFSRFAAMIRSSPVLPLIGGGATKFQPVFVGDVTAGLLDLLKRPDTVGKTYEFAGPQVYSFRALLQLLLTALNRQRVLFPIPFALAEMQARLLELLPNSRLTRDQVRLLKTDKVVSGVEPTLGDWGYTRGLLRSSSQHSGTSTADWRSAPNQMSWAVTNTDPSDSSNPAFSFWAARSSIISRWASNIRLRAVSETSLH